MCACSTCDILVCDAAHASYSNAQKKNVYAQKKSDKFARSFIPPTSICWWCCWALTNTRLVVACNILLSMTNALEDSATKTDLFFFCFRISHLHFDPSAVLYSFMFLSISCEQMQSAHYKLAVYVFGASGRMVLTTDKQQYHTYSLLMQFIYYHYYYYLRRKKNFWA